MNAIDNMLAEHAAALARREDARQAFAAADAECIAITNVIREQGSAGLPGSSLNYRTEWLRAAERASAALFEGHLPEAHPTQIEEARLRWKSTVQQLLAALIP